MSEREFRVETKRLTERTPVDFDTHGNEIIPLSRVETDVSSNDRIREIISHDGIIISISHEVLLERRKTSSSSERDAESSSTDHNDSIFIGVIEPIVSIIGIHQIVDGDEFFRCSTSLSSDTGDIVSGT